MRCLVLFPFFRCCCRKFTQCSDVPFRASDECLFMFFIISCFRFVFMFLFFLCLSASLSLARPLCSAYFQCQHVILNIIFVMCRNVLFNYDDDMMERRGDSQNSLITIVFQRAVERVSTLLCITRLCTRLAILGKSYTAFDANLKTIIFSKCKSAHAFFHVFVYCYLCHCSHSLTPWKGLQFHLKIE